MNSRGRAMITARPRRPVIQAATLAILLCFVATPARAQDSLPTGQAAPTYAYAKPQGFYATPQAYRPCTCYFPQGYCPFPQGNCVAVRPSSQYPFGSPQFDTTQPTFLAPAIQAR